MSFVFQMWSMLAGYDSLTKRDNFISFLTENNCTVVTLLLKVIIPLSCDSGSLLQ